MSKRVVAVGRVSGGSVALDRIAADFRPDLERTYAGLITDPIGESEARFIAAYWHGGQSSALYAFASSGHLDAWAALREAQDAMAGTMPSEDDDPHVWYRLMELIDYLERHQAV